MARNTAKKRNPKHDRNVARASTRMRRNTGRDQSYGPNSWRMPGRDNNPLKINNQYLTLETRDVTIVSERA